MPADPEDAGPALRRHCPGCEHLGRELARERARFAAFKRILIRHVERTGNARQSEELMALCKYPSPEGDGFPAKP